ncbi:MAG: hypothetical protein IT258_15350 [Saprospiraceae bacterium]|nr:hypothetical protein [Saprospiraceae bacterium]
MKSSDLLLLLQKLPAEDRRALRKFVRSPYHNLREDVQLLFEFLDKKLEKDFPGITNEAVWEAAYTSQPFDHQQLRYCMSYLTKVIEAYLASKEATADPVQWQLHLAAAYRRLGLEKPTRHSLERATELHQRSGHHDLHFYEKNYLLEAETLAFSEGTKRTAPRNLQAVNHSLDLAFLAKKLRQSCVALSHGAVANVAYDTGLLNLVLGYLEEAPWLDAHPAIALYFYFYQAATTGNDSYFAKLKNGIFDNGQALPASELRLVYLLAINFCIQQYNKGEGRYLKEVFDLYRSALERNVLLENGQLSRYAFKNIAGIAIRLGEFEWTGTFIEKIGPMVEARHRRNYTDYNLAKLHHACGEYDKAMRLLHKVEYEDLFLNLDAKILLLKIYFEQGETEALESLLQSFQRFIQRKGKELGYHKENYLNTLYFTNKLLTINPLNKEQKEQLRQEILETKAVGEREWLLERFIQTG